MTEIEHDSGRVPRTQTAHILYFMHGLAPFTFWLLALVAVIVGAAGRDEVRGTFVESHYSWLSRTFWWGLLWIVICSILTFILWITIIGIIVSWVPFTVLFVWYLYRVIRGWLRLNDGLPAPQ